jgi:hypothetical protein
MWQIPNYVFHLTKLNIYVISDLGQISSEEEEGEVETTLVEGADDQQAAEAMVQLGNFGFFANPQQGK